MKLDIITLSNGKRVANFSSPHPFTFTDGSILPAVSDEDAERLKVTFIEEHIGYTGDIKLSFAISPELRIEMTKWMVLKEDGAVDVVFCPLPMLTALKQVHSETWLLNSPFRAIRMDDRIRKVVSIDKQCI